MSETKAAVELRALTHHDLKDFMTWAGDRTVTESLTWDAYQDEGEALTFLKNVAEKHPWFKAIIVNGRAVGAVTLSVGQGRNACRAELGYVVAREHWGHGYASMASRLAIVHGFRDLNIQRIEAFVDPANTASVRVLENAGLNREALLEKYVIHRGQIRDRFIYSISK